MKVHFALPHIVWIVLVIKKGLQQPNGQMIQKCQAGLIARAVVFLLVKFPLFIFLITETNQVAIIK